MEKRLATIEEDGWQLDDGEVIGEAHPETFWVPALAERQALQAGQLVKLIFRIVTADEQDREEQHVERMWVVVTGREGDLYSGELDNQPYCTEEMAPGMPLWFEARHVINIHKEGEEE
ncbi:hypothetical protein [Cupriavidus basilensis]|uniref:DUF2314 domain-containing protein n=1 Tax=Cupriavidus basilensis TaxID=68895 RepID=A0A0C4Y7E4_9BURK|nr:hypothetical protein [Cupriavidus basilensis]AJG21337.1 hypothetical protein RR42_m3987 [Cupriavidus basilensis]